MIRCTMSRLMAGALIAFPFSVTALTPLSDPYVASVERQGSVQYEFYPRAAHATGFPGLTTFHLSYRGGNWKHSHETRRDDNRTMVKVDVRIGSASVAVTHVIRLPVGFTLTNAWYRSLVYHERDHVLISADARPKLLLEQLIVGLTNFEHELASHRPPTPKTVNLLIQEELNLRKDAVVDLIGKHYKTLDLLTGHGKKPLANREQFFAALYQEQTLRDLKFKYLEELLPLVRRLDSNQALVTHVIP